ncbi:MAG: hypothetical protein E6L03_09910 [Thaumarchaeota archaeon]|nr:MAG: hypothetical protein E6L03_09910 [Nitrososphaerota archaeon]
MKRSTFLGLIVAGLLIGASQPFQVFANYGYNRITSGSYILRGMVTSGGASLTSASYTLFGAISSERPASQLTSASFKLDLEWPSLILIPQTATASPTLSLAINSVLAAITTTESLMMSLVVTALQALTIGTMALTMSLSTSITAPFTNTASLTMSLVPSIIQDITVVLSSLAESLVSSITQDITIGLSKTMSLAVALVSETQFLVLCTIGVGDCAAAFSIQMNLTPSITQDIEANLQVISLTLLATLTEASKGFNALVSLTESLSVTITQDIEANLSSLSESLSLSISAGGHALEAAFSLVMALGPTITQDIEANLSSLSESLSLSISAGGHALEAAFSLVMALGPSITQDIENSQPLIMSLVTSINQNLEVILTPVISLTASLTEQINRAFQEAFTITMSIVPSITQNIEANLSNLSENLITSISTGGHALEAAFALTMSLGLTMQTFMAHAYEAVFLISTFLNASITQNIEIATQFISESLLASLTSLQAHGFEEIITASESLVLTIEGAFIAGIRGAGGATIIVITTTVQAVGNFNPNAGLDFIVGNALQLWAWIQAQIEAFCAILDPYLAKLGIPQIIQLPNLPPIDICWLLLLLIIVAIIAWLYSKLKTEEEEPKKLK